MKKTNKNDGNPDFCEISHKGLPISVNKWYNQQKPLILYGETSLCPSVNMEMTIPYTIIIGMIEKILTRGNCFLWEGTQCRIF